MNTDNTVSVAADTSTTNASRLAILVLNSKNEKLGKVSATYASIHGSCPRDCAHMNNGCYAQLGMVAIHSSRLDKASRNRSRIDARETARAEARLILGAIQRQENKLPMRLHVSGDCRTESACATLSQACKNWNNPIWTYTHAWKNVKRETWGDHISVLASVDSKADMPLAHEKGYATAITVDFHPADGKAWKLDNGFKVIPCPSQTRDVKCDSCRLCWNDKYLLENKATIAFAAHGVQKKKLNVIR